MSFGLDLVRLLVFIVLRRFLVDVNLLSGSPVGGESEATRFKRFKPACLERPSAACLMFFPSKRSEAIFPPVRKTSFPSAFSVDRTKGKIARPIDEKILPKP